MVVWGVVVSRFLRSIADSMLGKSATYVGSIPIEGAPPVEGGGGLLFSGAWRLQSLSVF